MIFTKKFKFKFKESLEKKFKENNFIIKDFNFVKI